jgi:glutamate 5-kinase
MSDPTRQQTISRAGTVVIKVGTNVLADSTGLLDRARIRSLTDQVQRVRATGRQVVLVSSGAIGAGIGKLNLGRRPADLPHLQACAAIGQSALMQLYQESLAPYGVHAGQLLLTAGDFDSRARYLNVRNTILTLFEYNCLPIINENDTVSVAEIKFGDNDHLAAMVANLLQAPLLVLLTNVDGLFTADPRVDVSARLIPTVPHIDRSITDLAAATRSNLGTGGMRSKLRAARVATAAGGAVVMANGSVEGMLDAIFASEPVGTLFLPHGEAMPAWKRWLGYTARPEGTLIVDGGASRAIVNRGASLLPVGVRSVRGDFGKGAIITVCDESGREIGRGLVNYSSVDAARITGLSTEQIVTRLGKLPYEEMIHRDNLVVTST